MSRPPRSKREQATERHPLLPQLATLLLSADAVSVNQGLELAISLDDGELWAHLLDAVEYTGGSWSADGNRLLGGGFSQGKVLAWGRTQHARHDILLATLVAHSPREDLRASVRSLALRALADEELPQLSFRFLARFPNLAYLEIDSSMAARVLPHLAGVPGLVGLSIAGKSPLRDLAGIRSLENLKHLHIDAPLASTKGIEGSGLETLYIRAQDKYGVTLQDIRGLGKTNVRRLEIPARNLDLSELDGCSKLEHLSLTNSDRPLPSGSGRWRATLETLELVGSSWPSLETLRGASALSSVRLPGSTIADLSALAELPALSSLCLEQIRTQHLDVLPKVALVDVYGQKTHKLSIDGAVRSLAAIHKLDGLTELDLSGCSELVSLAGLEQSGVRVLDLRNCLGIKDFSPLSQMPELRWVSLWKTRAERKSSAGLLYAMDFSDKPPPREALRRPRSSESPVAAWEIGRMLLSGQLAEALECLRTRASDAWGDLLYGIVYLDASLVRAKHPAGLYLRRDTYNPLFSRERGLRVWHSHPQQSSHWMLLLAAHAPDASLRESVRVLTLRASGSLPDILLDALSRFPNLSELTVQDADERVLERVAQCPALEKLNIDRFRGTLAPLGASKALRHLHITGENYQIPNLLSPLSDLPLESLVLRASNAPDLSPLRGCPLKTLILSYSTIGDGSALAEIPTLQKLALERVQIAALDVLPRVALVDSQGAPAHKLSLDASKIESIRGIGQLQGLRWLSLRGCSQLASLEGIEESGIEVLDLQGCTRLADFSPLERMPALRWAELRGTKCSKARFSEALFPKVHFDQPVPPTLLQKRRSRRPQAAMPVPRDQEALWRTLVPMLAVYTSQDLDALLDFLRANGTPEIFKALLKSRREHWVGIADSDFHASMRLRVLGLAPPEIADPIIEEIHYLHLRTVQGILDLRGIERLSALKNLYINAQPQPSIAIAPDGSHTSIEALKASVPLLPQGCRVAW